MNKEIADKWVSALRSGTYKQGKTFLNKDDELCCLGVLCEILEIPKAPSNFGAVRYEDSYRLLPFKVMKIANMKTNTGTIRPHLFSLVDLNDAGASFNEIADTIEANWEAL